MQFLEFYWGVLWRMPSLFWHSLVTVEGILSVIGFIALYVIGSAALNRWTELHLSRRRLVVWGVVLYFVFLLLQSNFAAFTDIKNANTAAIAEVNTKLDGVLSELKIKNVLNDQLTKENGALAAGGRVLTDSQARIEAIREQFLAHADKAPTKEQFTTETAMAWYREATGMKDQSVDYNSTLYFEFVDERTTYDKFRESVGQFRGIAANLTEDALRKTVRSPEQ
jgi:hypothetical protein